ncbi:hypothetical protein AAJCM20276_37850 (plasmid) [Acetobacter aceti]|uniref:Uncharacterized protein n=1 Tax=Acetobacter aceti TaxID=435 RepID=A0A6S6PR42_ACEAC|nr:hypothetical protein AAJCM20276_37850 [Acetobacter aceti]
MRHVAIAVTDARITGFDSRYAGVVLAVEGIIGFETRAYSISISL